MSAWPITTYFMLLKYLKKKKDIFISPINIVHTGSLRVQNSNCHMNYHSQRMCMWLCCVKQQQSGSHRSYSTEHCSCNWSIYPSRNPFPPLCEATCRHSARVWQGRRKYTATVNTDINPRHRGEHFSQKITLCSSRLWNRQKIHIREHTTQMKIRS